MGFKILFPKYRLLIGTSIWIISTFSRIRTRALFLRHYKEINNRIILDVHSHLLHYMYHRPWSQQQTFNGWGLSPDSNRYQIRGALDFDMLRSFSSYAQHIVPYSLGVELMVVST